MKSDGGHSIESIFDGKRKFHKSMANLPIEEKLRIVAALQRIDYSIKPAVWKKRMMWRDPFREKGSLFNIGL